jgi:hypothetical protein
VKPRPLRLPVAPVSAIQTRLVERQIADVAQAFSRARFVFGENGVFGYATGRTHDAVAIDGHPQLRRAKEGLKHRESRNKSSEEEEKKKRKKERKTQSIFITLNSNKLK